VEQARLTVVTRRPVRAPRVPFVTLVAALLVVGVVGLLLFNTSMQQASFAATSMEQRAEMLASRQQVLQMELDDLRDPQELAVRAKRLGMVPAGGPAFLRLSDGEVLGSPTVADAGDGIRIAPLPPVKPKSLRPDPVILQIKPVRRGDTRASGPGEHDRTGKKERERRRAGGER